ncbi:MULTISPECIES: TetR family transcriptional regulator [Streptomyces]|uniref:TetR family transcriptional regulator n=1 Tax=Streptomyces TaxID=1883 RepID=UPI001162072D|nr:TetR family transcriptional regulator [Streptomyces sp. RLB3-6]QDN85754.1 TetR family transcriptional regulator [Streptomyces sp. RLB3-6]
MSGDARIKTRDIARAAIRAELAQVALDLFQRDGFDRVTINDVVAAAGVSRNTFLRYFGTKEDAVLAAFDAWGEQVADAVRARPADEGDWTALRRGLDLVAQEYRQDPASVLATARLIRQTPSLRARNLEKQCGWRPLLAGALAERDLGGARRPEELDLLVRAAAALDCLDIAVDHWAEAEGRLSLDDLLDAAFAALTAG